MKWSLSVLLSVSAFCACVSCTRASAASLVPKLDLSCQLRRVRQVADARTSDRAEVGISAWLRWQPSIAAASVPERYELSPSGWLAPCELDDAPCVAEFAQDEQEIAAALREAP